MMGVAVRAPSVAVSLPLPMSSGFGVNVAVKVPLQATVAYVVTSGVLALLGK